MTHPKQKKKRRSDTSLKEKQKASKNKQINGSNSGKWTAINVELQTGRDSTNVRPEGRNAQNAKRSAITRNVAEQTRK